MDDLPETRGYWKLKDETLDRTLWRTSSGRGYIILPLNPFQFLYLPTISRRTALVTDGVGPIIRVQVFRIKWPERTDTPKSAEPSPR